MKTIGMMQCICAYYENCKKIIQESSKTEKKISMALIEEAFGTSIIADLARMKFILPETPESEIKMKLDKLAEEIENEFRRLLHG